MPQGSKPGERRGGRQKGTPNRATIEKRIRAEHGIAAAKANGLLPLDIMLQVAAGGEAAAQITDRQLHAAIAAAPYVHAKLAAVAVALKTPQDVVDEAERAEARAWVLKQLADMAKPEPLLLDHDEQSVRAPAPRQTGAIRLR
jgi:hypothetical protein